MNVINQLLKQVPQQEIQKYQSSVHLHLKNMMTLLNKKKLQKTGQLELKMHKCMIQCYQHTFQQQSLDLQNLSQCKKNCRKPIDAVKQYLDDINFYSEKKFNGCSSKCYKMEKETEQNSCVWECLNRLDRRYKKYWQQKRQQVQAKYR